MFRRPSFRPSKAHLQLHKPLSDRTIRFAVNVWAGWAPIIFANNGFKAGKLWKVPGGKDFQSRADPD